MSPSLRVVWTFSACLLCGCFSEPSAPPVAAPAVPPTESIPAIPSVEPTTPTTPTSPRQAEAPTPWTELFDGKSLEGWKVTEFGGEGQVFVEDGQIVMEMGNDLTGVTWVGVGTVGGNDRADGEIPKDGYEVQVEAKKIDGNDFFCCVTFPVGDSFCSFVVGGWGGTVVGLSSLDGQDAARNETKKVMGFDSDRWYTIKIRVAEGRVQASIDGAPVVDMAVAGRTLSLRPEVELCRPLGVCCFQTVAAIRKISLRSLSKTP